jgi:hypothetical protein
MTTILTKAESAMLRTAWCGFSQVVDVRGKTERGATRVEEAKVSTSVEALPNQPSGLKYGGVGVAAWAPIALFVSLALCACQPNALPNACPQIPVIDGFRTVLAEGGRVTLRVPEFAQIHLTQDCKQARWIGLSYLWHDGKLISERIVRATYLNDRQITETPVNVILNVFGSPTELGERRQHWQFDPALPHKVYPLEMYPRAYWRDPAVRPAVEPPDVLWGVRGTRDPITHRPFTAACDIYRANPLHQESVVTGEFRKSGDAMCRGWVYAVSGPKAVGGMIDVWANGAPEIDKIYNSAATQFETFIAKD